MQETTPKLTLVYKKEDIDVTSLKCCFGKAQMSYTLRVCPSDYRRIHQYFSEARLGIPPGDKIIKKFMRREYLIGHYYLVWRAFQKELELILKGHSGILKTNLPQVSLSSLKDKKVVTVKVVVEFTLPYHMSQYFKLDMEKWNKRYDQIEFKVEFSTSS